MTSIVFIDQATDEFREAVRYYNNERAGLGFEFASEIRTALSRIKLNPDTWIEIGAGIRRCMVRRFPYSLLYIIDGSRIVIIAVMHMRQKPGYWKDRMQE